MGGSSTIVIKYFVDFAPCSSLRRQMSRPALLCTDSEQITRLDRPHEPRLFEALREQRPVFKLFKSRNYFKTLRHGCLRSLRSPHSHIIRVNQNSVHDVSETHLQLTKRPTGYLRANNQIEPQTRDLLHSTSSTYDDLPLVSLTSTEFN